MSISGLLGVVDGDDDSPARDYCASHQLPMEQGGEEAHNELREPSPTPAPSSMAGTAAAAAAADEEDGNAFGEFAENETPAGSFSANEEEGADPSSFGPQENVEESAASSLCPPPFTVTSLLQSDAGIIQHGMTSEVVGRENDGRPSLGLSPPVVVQDQLLSSNDFGDFDNGQSPPAVQATLSQQEQEEMREEQHHVEEKKGEDTDHQLPAATENSSPPMARDAPAADHDAQDDFDDEWVEDHGSDEDVDS